MPASRITRVIGLLLAALLLAGCSLPSVDQLQTSGSPVHTETTTAANVVDPMSVQELEALGI